MARKTKETAGSTTGQAATSATTKAATRRAGRPASGGKPAPRPAAKGAVPAKAGTRRPPTTPQPSPVSAPGSTVAAEAAASVDKSNWRTLEETAHFFGVTQPTARSWIRHGCPVEEEGGNGRAYQLDLAKVAAWRQALEAEKVKAEEGKAERDSQLRLELLGGDALTAGDGGAARPMTAKERADFTTAEVARVKLAQLRGELVNAEAAQLEVTRAVATLRDQIRTLPDVLAGRLNLDDATVNELARTLDDWLTDLADAIAAGGEGVDDASRVA